MSNRDYNETSAILSADFATMLESHPEAFDCLFYKAELGTKEVTAPSIIEDVVGDIEGTQRTIEYADPVPSRAMVAPDTASSNAYEAGHGEDYYSEEEPVVILLNEVIVPKQSIIKWTEKTEIDSENTEEKTVSYYILESKPFGRAPVAGMKHYCIPLFNEQVPEP